MISLEQIPLPISGVVGRVMENPDPTKTEAVIVLPNKGQVKVLNEVGTRIWSLIDGKRTVGDIANMIVQEYQVSQDVAQNDTVLFLTELNQKGVIGFSE